jgi:hypothetical protein
LSGAPVASPTAAAAAVATSAVSQGTQSSAGGSTSQAQAVLSKIGAKAAVNPTSNNGEIWIGTDGPYTNTFTNSASQDVTVVVWGPQGSWVNANAPQVGITLSAGQSATVSFANGVSAGWAGIYSDTQLVNGQISNTWGEATFSGIYSCYDVSREVNMNGHTMSIVTPGCTSNMNTCVFVCNSGTTCMTGYSLENCATGSQPGASTGTYGGAASGGCMGMSNSAALKTTFS